VRPLKFRAIIKYNSIQQREARKMGENTKFAVIYFTLLDLLNPNFSNRTLLVPWLKEGNEPDESIGLLDRNLKQIWEGDVVNLIPDGYTPYANEVIYDPIMCAFGFLGIRGVGKGWISIDKFLSNAPISQIEIIGNTRENPELRKERK